MPVDPNIFGTPYLDAESFRAGAALFGAGMSLADYPVTDNDSALTRTLAAASRVIDAETGLDFSPGVRTEEHAFNFETRQIKVNNPPVSEISDFRIIFSPGNNQIFRTADLYFNNQLNYVEVTSYALGLGVISEYLNLGLASPVAVITYKSAQDIPQAVRLACGYQTAKMINDGFVDKELPPNFGQVDMGGLTINNKKGYRLKREDIQASMLDPTAERLLAAFKRVSIR